MWKNIPSPMAIVNSYEKNAWNKKHHKCSSFNEAGYLKTHINSVYLGNKDHKCDSCAKSFSTVGNLKKHIDEVHNAQKDHKCESCGKLFSQAGTLKMHNSTLMQFIMAKKITNMTCRKYT